MDNFHGRSSMAGQLATSKSFQMVKMILEIS